LFAERGWARFLGLNEVLVDGPRRCERVADRLGGDLVEHEAMHGNAGAQGLAKVPGDRLSFAVFVGRQIKFIRFF
jgi:hypothetical protein